MQQEKLPQAFINLAKLGNGLNESPTVVVGDNRKQQQQLGKNRAYWNPVERSLRPISNFTYNWFNGKYEI